MTANVLTYYKTFCGLSIHRHSCGLGTSYHLLGTAKKIVVQITNLIEHVNYLTFHETGSARIIIQ